MVTEQPEFKADCELIWVKLEVTGSHPLYIGAYYKPKEEDQDSLIELRKSLEKVGKKNGNIWLLGNFNLPGLTWTDNISLPKSTLTSKPFYEYFLDLINDLGLCQMVTEPTRHSPDNTLYHFLTSNPTMIQKVDIMPGLGDHDVVMDEGLIKAKTPKSPFVCKGRLCKAQIYHERFSGKVLFKPCWYIYRRAMDLIC